MNLVQLAVSNGGKLSPLLIKEGLNKGTGLMNPSIFIDDDGDILVNLRHVNYSMYHAEKNMKFPSAWGPLAYLHPEKDQTLRTYNYLCKLDKDLKITHYTLVDTKSHDVPPLWEFHGLEDARIVKWNNILYLIGVRRDTDEIGTGRMEYSQISLNKKKWTAKEVSRVRIPAPGANDSYCEKNWYPIIDKPFHFVKWTSPSEIVKAEPHNPAICEVVSINEEAPKVNVDLRGGSQLIPWGKYYINITHEAALWYNYLNQKNGQYRHRLCVWNEHYDLIGISPEPFSFLDAAIEFCTGAAQLEEDLLLTFGFSDSTAFVLKVPKIVVDNMIGDAIENANN